MSAPAAYTPAVLSRIRNGACAADLGWDEPRYHGICRRHGLIPIASPSPDRKSHTMARDARPKVEDPRDMVASIGAALHFDLARRLLFHNRKCAKLSVMQSAVFGALLRHYHTGAAGCINATAIVESIWDGGGAIQVPTAVKGLRRKLFALGLVIEGRKGHGAGYRLRIEGGAATPDRTNAPLATAAM